MKTLTSTAGIFLPLFACAVIGVLPLPAAEYYVSGSGNDQADGLDVSRTFRTLERASRLVNPGDTIWVMNGTYTGSSTNGNVVDLTRSGTPAAWITLKAYPGHRPELIVNGWGGVNIMANYQIVDGLLITGNNDNVTLAQAEADAAKPDCSPAFTNGGISSDGRGVVDKYHHMIVRNCIIRKCGAGGLGGCQVDYLTFEDNQIYDTCWYNRFGCSAISLYQSWNFDQAPGYHNIIRRNKIWNNRNLVRWYVNNQFMDGNGIIIDDSKNLQNGSLIGPYTGRTLIYDNVCFNNGGSGIHIYSSEHVDVVNNTTFNNGTKVLYPEIDANFSNDVKILNNIMYAAPNGDVNENIDNTNVTYDYNVYCNGRVVVTGPHDVIADPRLVAPSLDPLTADFRLLAGSPAADSAMPFEGVTNVPDFSGLVRPQGAGADRGAYERLVIQAPAGSGTGLLGAYFNSRDLTGPALTRVDSGIRFDWGTGSPLAGIGSDAFSVRWTGQVQAQFSELYTFSTISDDGIRLWVNGQLVIDNWTEHAPMENVGSIALTAGQKYEVTLEYFESSGGAVAQLWWESASTTKQSVPSSQLYPPPLPINGLPMGWSAADIGVVGAAGSSSQINGIWTVLGSGDDIWNTADSFHFVSRQVTGDVMITAQVNGLTNTDAWAKAGVMVRESLASEARHASTFATAGNGLAFQRRIRPAGASLHTAGPGTAAPQWVRIERVQDQLISSSSVNGVTWTEIRRQTITMTPTVYVGLAVSSHRRGSLCTATFSNVQVVAAGAGTN